MTTQIIADIGGTYARFALRGDTGAITQVQSLRTADFKKLADAIGTYLQIIQTESVQDAIVSIAAPLTGDQVKMTNAAWNFSIQQTLSDLGQKIGLQSLRVINDFEALALAVPTLQTDELIAIGHNLPIDSIQTKAILGPGTGLGMAGVMPLLAAPTGLPKWVAIPCEGGHASFVPSNEREIALLQTAWTITSRPICWEDFLSGTGLPLLYRAVCALDGFHDVIRTPADITQAAFMNNDVTCLATLHTFCALLGAAAGDLALMMNARGGIYLKGGVLDHVFKVAPDFLQRSQFRQRFEAKGAYSAHLQTIPTWFITTQQLALLGCATLFD